MRTVQHERFHRVTRRDVVEFAVCYEALRLLRVCVGVHVDVADAICRVSQDGDGSVVFDVADERVASSRITRSMYLSILSRVAISSLVSDEAQSSFGEGPLS